MLLAKSIERDGLSVVLVSTRNPLNIGAAARAMSNFGFSQLRLVNPYEPSFREAKSAVGAAAVLAGARVYTSVAEAIADCRLIVGTTAAQNRELHQPLQSLAEAARLIRRRMGSGRVALLFGSEKRGLSNHDLSHCHWLLHIPTREAHLSMNLGQAVAVCLYELERSEKWPARLEKTLPASAGQTERITTTLFELLQGTGYVNPRATLASEEKTRRMVGRLRLSEGDADVCLGMLRQILWKLDEKSQRKTKSHHGDAECKN